MENIKSMTIAEAIDILDNEIEYGEIGKVASIEFIIAKNVLVQALELRTTSEERKKEIF